MSGFVIRTRYPRSCSPISNYQSALIRGITCLSKYSDELSITASNSELALAGTNSSKTAFGRITFSWAFFESYKVLLPSLGATGVTESQAAEEEEVIRATVNLKVSGYIKGVKPVGCTKAEFRPHVLPSTFSVY